MDRIENKKKPPHSDISEIVIGCCFEVIKELGAGFLENVYKNALFIAMKQKGLNVTAEQPFEVMFRNCKIGKYVADLIVENVIVVELKCCAALLPEHKAQVINYLKVSGVPVGLLVNFGAIVLISATPGDSGAAPISFSAMTEASGARPEVSKVAEVKTIAIKETQMTALSAGAPLAKSRFNSLTWEFINWRKVYATVKKLQMRIAKAFKSGKHHKAKA